jgi:hypothetical protein
MRQRENRTRRSTSMMASIASAPLTTVSATPSAERTQFAELAKSLRSGDLDAAKQAYANVVRNAPEGKTWPTGSPFADLGKALVRGDVDAARTAFASMCKGKTGAPPVGGGEAVSSSSVPPATTGDKGTLLNVVA